MVSLGLTTAAGLFAAGWWWPFELLSNLPLQHAVALLLLTAIAIALRAWVVAAVGAVGLVVNLALVVPVLHATTFGQPPAAEAGASSFSVTFFNTKIEHGGIDATLTELARRDDDVVVLAATTRVWLDAIAEADLGLHPVVGPHTHSQLELIVLVRDPDTPTRVHEVTGADRDVVVEVELELDDGGVVHLLGTHVVSPLTAERAARWETMLAWLPDRLAQLDAPAVVVGDLNATPWSPGFRRLLDDGNLTSSQVGHGLQPSYPAWLGPLGVPIDHVLHGAELTTVDRRLGPSFASDHRMVHATLAPSAATD